MKTLPTPSAVKEELPIPMSLQKDIEQHRQTIQNILAGKDHRRLLIIGPDSVHDLLGAAEFAKLLTEAAKEIQKEIFIAMRVCLERKAKPGQWPGFILDPKLDGSCDTEVGIRQSRRLLLAIAGMGMPIAIGVGHELASYLDDLASMHDGLSKSWSRIVGYIYRGCQQFEYPIATGATIDPRQSITKPCLGWPEAVRLIKNLHA